MRWLLLFLIVIPATEIGVLLLSGKTIGIVPTVLLIVFTGVFGAYLAKKQGIETIRKVQSQLRMGEIPSEALIDGVCILIGGIFLLTPGFITDAVGFLLLIPQMRNKLKHFLEQLFRRWIQHGNVWIIK